jgi:hypothetical protein
VLRPTRQAYTFFQEQLAAPDQKIIALLADIPQRPPPSPEDLRNGSSNAPPAQAAGELKGTVAARTTDSCPPPRAAAPTPSQAAKKGPRKLCKGGNPLPQGIRWPLAKIFGIDLTRVPGLNRLSVLIVLSQVGTDLEKALA